MPRAWSRTVPVNVTTPPHRSMTAQSDACPAGNGSDEIATQSSSSSGGRTGGIRPEYVAGGSPSRCRDVSGAKRVGILARRGV
ncbi:MAG: hypothetical protein NVS1B12_15810 [Acidimicrobiales bacterium]